MKLPLISQVMILSLISLTWSCHKSNKGHYSQVAIKETIKSISIRTKYSLRIITRSITSNKLIMKKGAQIIMGSNNKLVSLKHQICNSRRLWKSSNKFRFLSKLQQAHMLKWDALESSLIRRINLSKSKLRYLIEIIRIIRILNNLSNMLHQEEVSGVSKNLKT